MFIIFYRNMFIFLFIYKQKLLHQALRFPRPVASWANFKKSVLSLIEFWIRKTLVWSTAISAASVSCKSSDNPPNLFIFFSITNIDAINAWGFLFCGAIQRQQEKPKQKENTQKKTEKKMGLWLQFCQNTSWTYMTFRILLQNLRSIHRNLNELDQFINKENSKPDVIALTETWCNQYTFQNPYQLNGYGQLLRCDRDKRGGGVGFFIRKGIKVQIKAITNNEHVQFLTVALLGYQKESDNCWL